MINVTLPPKEGYVEVEVNGERVYQAIPRHPAILIPTLEEENKMLNAKLVASNERAAFMDSCIAEMAGVLYQ